jgi:rubrerythrin
MRSLDSFSEREILALAISLEELEEEDERVYADSAERLSADFPASAAVLDGMRQEESEHRTPLLERYRQRFGDHRPLIRRQDVRGFVARHSPWFVRSLGPDVIRRQAAAAELESRRFYERAAARTTDPETRELLDDLAQAERGHEERADTLERELLTPECERRKTGPPGGSSSSRSSSPASPA